jgi:hypothetical protein
MSVESSLPPKFIDGWRSRNVPSVNYVMVHTKRLSGIGGAMYHRSLILKRVAQAMVVVYLGQGGHKATKPDLKHDVSALALIAIYRG